MITIYLWSARSTCRSQPARVDPLWSERSDSGPSVYVFEAVRELDRASKRHPPRRCLATDRTLVAICRDHPFFSTNGWFIGRH
jgi:hypothetical protein